MIIKEILAKSILSSSKVYPYVINPYVGCQHGCSYCYARFMKKFTGHKEPWGEFIDIKINAADLLRNEIRKKKPGKVWISGVCDPYQPLEEKYKLTRKCLEILVQYNWPFVIQTRSPLVTRDKDILKEEKSIDVGFSISTSDDKIRKVFEPGAPAIMDRIMALDELHRIGIKTYAMIAPLLPRAEPLAEILAGKIDYVLIDRMNYRYADWIYRKYNMTDKMTDDFFISTGEELASSFSKFGIHCDILF